VLDIHRQGCKFAVLRGSDSRVDQADTESCVKHLISDVTFLNKEQV